MDSFITIRFKRKTAKRFQQFSKTHFKTHTETMDAMLDFFFYNEISPKEKLGPTGRTIEAKLLKRINAVIAIMRDVEKTQTKPTYAMLELLFQESPEYNEPREELFEFEQQELITENEELHHYRNRYEEVQQQFHSVKYDLDKIIGRTTYVKGSFGGGYLKLDLTKEEFENIKQKL